MAASTRIEQPEGTSARLHAHSLRGVRRGGTPGLGVDARAPLQGAKAPLTRAIPLCARCGGPRYSSLGMHCQRQDARGAQGGSTSSTSPAGRPSVSGRPRAVAYPSGSKISSKSRTNRLRRGQGTCRRCQDGRTRVRAVPVRHGPAVRGQCDASMSPCGTCEGSEERDTRSEARLSGPGDC